MGKRRTHLARSRSAAAVAAAVARTGGIGPAPTQAAPLGHANGPPLLAVAVSAAAQSLWRATAARPQSLRRVAGACDIPHLSGASDREEGVAVR